MTNMEKNDALVKMMEDAAIQIGSEIFEVVEILFDAYPDVSEEDQTGEVMEAAYRVEKVQALLEKMQSAINIYLGPHLHKEIKNSIVRLSKRDSETLARAIEEESKTVGE